MTESSLNLFVCFSVKGPELINMYVGQSEENIREGLFHLKDHSGVFQLVLTEIISEMSECVCCVQCSAERAQQLRVSSSLMSWTLWLPAGGAVETLEG